jgi:hypothetical protein
VTIFKASCNREIEEKTVKREKGEEQCGASRVKRF